MLLLWRIIKIVCIAYLGIYFMKLADAEDGKTLRTKVSKLTEHVRVCTLNAGEFCQEVVPAKVLTDGEVALVCMSIGQQEKQEGLTEICNEIKPRRLIKKKEKPAKSTNNQFELKFTNHAKRSGHTSIREFNFVIVVTEKCDIELLPLECLALCRSQMTPEGATYEVSCTTTITRIIDHQSDTSTETPGTVRFNQRVECGTPFMMPLTSGEHNVTLLANNRYTFRMVFGGHQLRYWDDPETPGYDNSHLSLIIQPHATLQTRHYVPMNGLKYKAMDA